MASVLVERYDDRIAAVLSCYDRAVVTGTLPSVCHAEGMTRFLYARQIRIFDYPEFAMTLRDRVREAAASLAAEAGIAIEHVAKGESMTICGVFTLRLLEGQLANCRSPGRDTIVRKATGACRRAPAFEFEAAGAHRALSTASAGVWRSVC